MLTKSPSEEFVIDFETLHEPLKTNFEEFVKCYLYLAQQKGISDLHAKKVMHSLFLAVKDQLNSPFLFPSVHRIHQENCPYFSLGLEVAKPLIHNITHHNLHILEEIQQRLKNKENIILAANHQTELEPQILSLACDFYSKDFFKNTFFVAGERVTTDPMAAPLSRGRNLFCIFAKRYVADDKQEQIDRKMHNLKTIKQMKELLNQGGVCIYVALGGGRDRSDESGRVQLTPFDPSSVGLFTLLCDTAKQPTHIYPLVIESFNVLPPPATVQKELGERRWTAGGDVSIKFAERFDYTPYLQIADKELQMQVLTQKLFSQLLSLYSPVEALRPPEDCNSSVLYL